MKKTKGCFGFVGIPNYADDFTVSYRIDIKSGTFFSAKSYATRKSALKAAKAMANRLNIDLVEDGDGN